MTNVCFIEAIKLGHGNGDRLGNHGGHAPTMEIILVFKGWTVRQEQSSWAVRYSERPGTELHHPLTLNSEQSNPL